MVQKDLHQLETLLPTNQHTHAPLSLLSFYLILFLPQGIFQLSRRVNHSRSSKMEESFSQSCHIAPFVKWEKLSKWVKIT